VLLSTCTAPSVPALLSAVAPITSDHQYIPAASAVSLQMKAPAHVDYTGDVISEDLCDFLCLSAVLLEKTERSLTNRRVRVLDRIVQHRGLQYPHIRDPRSGQEVRNGNGVVDTTISTAQI